MMSEIDDIYLRSAAMARRNGFRRRVLNAHTISSPNLTRSLGSNWVKLTKISTRQLPPASSDEELTSKVLDGHYCLTEGKERERLQGVCALQNSATPPSYSGHKPPVASAKHEDSGLPDGKCRTLWRQLPPPRTPDTR